MNTDRRSTARRPFEGTVELALHDDAEAYEADGVDIGLGGMAMRTAFLPDIGTELECRFAFDDGEPVLAKGEVIWAQDSGADAGAFGVRFVDMADGDEKSLRDALCRRGLLSEEAEPNNTEVQPAAPVPAPVDDSRVRLHIPSTGAPLRARVRTRMDDVIVLGSDLSFLKLGEHVEVEQGETRTRGSIEDISIEVDSETRIARLVLTVSTPGRGGKEKDRVPVPVTSAAPMAMTAPRRASRPAAHATAKLPPEPTAPRVTAPAVSPIPADDTDGGRTEPQRAEMHSDRVADFESQGEEEVMDSRFGNLANGLDREGMDDAMDEDGLETDARDALESDLGSEEEHLPPKPSRARSVSANNIARPAPPQWLVSTLQIVQSTAKTAGQKLGPALGAVFKTIVALVSSLAAGLKGQRPVAPVAPVAGRSGLRKQNPSVGRGVEMAVAPVARAGRRYGYYILAVVGAGVAAFALVTGTREPQIATPRPQVALGDGSESGTEGDLAGDPGTMGLVPGTAMPMEGEGGPESDMVDGRVQNPAPGRSAGPSTVGARMRNMPTDLVAASRSRNALVDDQQLTIRTGRNAPAHSAATGSSGSTSSAARANTPVVAARGNASANTNTNTNTARNTGATARVIGNSSVTVGTILRLRMDGPVSGISGGPGAGNTIVVRVPGRQSLDLAAPLLSRDARLQNAGVRNRATGAELTLRFRETAPAFSARVRGNAIEIVLAAPARRAPTATTQPTRAGTTPAPRSTTQVNARTSTPAPVSRR